MQYLPKHAPRGASASNPVSGRIIPRNASAIAGKLFVGEEFISGNSMGKSGMLFAAEFEFLLDHASEGFDDPDLVDELVAGVVFVLDVALETGERGLQALD